MFPGPYRPYKLNWCEFAVFVMSQTPACLLLSVYSDYRDVAPPIYAKMSVNPGPFVVNEARCRAANKSRGHLHTPVLKCAVRKNGQCNSE